MKRHIYAWGHATLPDLNYETDDDTDERYKQYPIVSVALLTPISRKMIDDDLNQSPQHPVAE